MTDDPRELVHSGDWKVRRRAAELLRGSQDEAAQQWLTTLLHDQDLAVVAAAAATLLQRGEPGWVEVLEMVWAAEETGPHEALRSAFLDLLVAGEDIQPLLVDQAENPRSPQSARGALEVLMSLDLRPRAYILDENGE